MRDPDGALRFEPERVRRTLHRPLDDRHFLRSPLARDWVGRGLLVPYEELAPDELASPRLPFVSHPHEWCDAQLHAAAQLTLQLQQEAVAAGYDLKDASAWNVLFSGTRPVFCDLLSFMPLRERRWWALGQYARHFVLPLLLSGRRGLRAHQSFAVWRDGMPPDVARRLLGWTRFLGRHWPLMVGSSAEPGVAAQVDDVDIDGASLARFRAGLHATLGWWLSGAAPSGRGLRKSVWGGYTGDRTHYEGDSLERKRAKVAAWLDRLRPGWVADLGCNTGEFSLMALETGAQVVAIDGDHGAIEQMFRTGPASGLHPVICALDDAKGGAGWLGTEYPGLMQRLSKSMDLVMMLALVHHLAVAAAIPLDEVARMARGMSRGWLLVEWIGPGDRQMQRLCAQRKRDPQEFTLGRQKDAFLAAGFELVDELDLAPTPRTLALLRVRP